MTFVSRVPEHTRRCALPSEIRARSRPHAAATLACHTRERACPRGCPATARTASTAPLVSGRGASLLARDSSFMKAPTAVGGGRRQHWLHRNRRRRMEFVSRGYRATRRDHVRANWAVATTDGQDPGRALSNRHTGAVGPGGRDQPWAQLIPLTCAIAPGGAI